MRQNFAPSLASVLVHEGGKVDDPQDPGGRTAYGVTQTVYANWRRSQGLAPRDVWLIEDSEKAAIYRSLYWDKCRCDDLPSGVDYAVFDYSVNSGPVRAAKALQRAVGVIDDGQVGPMTLAAANAKRACETIAAISASRLAFLQGLSAFARFGRGWTLRVGEVGQRAAEMAS
jgi:lysozyme family protein